MSVILLTDMQDFSIICAICKKAPKIVGQYIRMACMCDDDVRCVHLDDINNPEHKWRFYLLDRKTELYTYANDQRLD